MQTQNSDNHYTMPILRRKPAMNAFDYKGQPSIWRRDEKLKRFKQGDEFAKKRQDKRDINDKEQVFIYSKALSAKK